MRGGCSEFGVKVRNMTWHLIEDQTCKRDEIRFQSKDKVKFALQKICSSLMILSKRVLTEYITYRTWSLRIFCPGSGRRCGGPGG